MEIADLTEDDLEAVLDVRNRSFGILPAGRRERWFELKRKDVAEQSSLVVRDGGRAVAAAHYDSFRQWWLGHPVAMGGVGGVVVAPEYRGRGVSGLLMRALLDRMREQRHPLSALFPATLPPYRRVGYELAGREHMFTVPTSVLRSLAGAGRSLPTLRRAGVDDAERAKAVLDDHYRRAGWCGPFTWEERFYALGLADEERYDYLADDGYLCYQWSGSEALNVLWAVAGSQETTRALWAQVGSHASIAGTVRTRLAPGDPLFWLLPDIGVAPDPSTGWWMNRLLDAPRAVADRGFPPSAEVDVTVELTDADLPANSGVWQLVVADGRGELRPHEEGPGDALRACARGMAALYAGVPVSTLRGSGLVTGGDPAADAGLDAAFRADPLVLDHF